MVIKIQGKEYLASATLKNMKIFKEVTGQSILDPQTLQVVDEEKLGAMIHAFTGGRVPIEVIDEMGIAEVTTITMDIVKMLSEETQSEVKKK